ncbi:MAG: 23S rRNA (adenine(2503)-C(2))-methyltransferase RlmN [Lachnospiraceae bacterium]|nr:23S rRNA (adenine(2503)-C(2))-methyltransferase RlmN [Lachnospiraceae bacterium]
MKPDIKSMTLPELEAYFLELGEKKFRAKQVYSWLHQKQAESYEEMTNLSAALRSRLAETTQLRTLKPLEVLTSQVDGTQKFLFALPDGPVIESVLMKYQFGNSVCISSQAGCRMGCRFCASTIGGRIRDLTASEMLDQIYRITRISGERVSHVVVMGTGEPLDNYDQLVRFIRILSGEDGLNLSQRNITVSTCGLAEKIEELAKEKLQITLALSLHASNQKKREALMPIARKYDIHQVLESCRIYQESTGRRLTFEYSLVAGVNDTDEDARELAALIRPLHGHVNLIPVNPIRERDYVRPDRRAVLAFQNKLEKSGINVTIRREMGSDISGACGQLRRSWNETHGETGSPEAAASRADVLPEE